MTTRRPNKLEKIKLINKNSERSHIFVKRRSKSATLMFEITEIYLLLNSLVTVLPKDPAVAPTNKSRTQPMPAMVCTTAI